MRSITVSASKLYSVLIDEGVLSHSGEKIVAACGGEKAALVTDDIVDRLYGNAVERSLRAAGYTTVKFVFPHGEQSKNMETYTALLNALTEANLTRSDVVVALGGGVVGDLAGFAAATYLRGVRFAQVPTTLLAMVDSSVGGKTAVNLSAGKNQAGAFYQPDIVFCDCGTLQSLPDDVFQDGCAEMVKHGVILSAELFELLKKPLLPQIEDIIGRNITIKRDIVAQDERDTGIRQILNFGHTIGHGIEKYSGYSVTHGKAVAIGMAIASLGAWRMGLCGEDCYLEVVAALKHYQLPYETGITPDKLIEATFSDKKRSGQNITLILPERIGKCVLKSFCLAEAAEFIRLGMRP
jgi:3-dehydroquinate synthase